MVGGEDGSARRWLNITSVERTTGSCSAALCDISAHSAGKRNDDDRRRAGIRRNLKTRLQRVRTAIGGGRMAKRMLATVDYVTPTGVLHLYRGASFLRQPLDRLVASHRCSSSSSSSSSSSFSSSSSSSSSRLRLSPRRTTRVLYSDNIVARKVVAGKCVFPG